MTQRDLQELEQAARAIVAVVERNRVSDETTEEQRAAFHFVSDEVKEKSPTISPEAKRNTALSFTAQEIEEMPNELKKLFITGAVIAHVRKNRDSYEIRVQLRGKRISASGQNLKIAKIRFLQKPKEYERMMELTSGIEICAPACGVGKFLLEPILHDLHKFYLVQGDELKPQITLYGYDKGFDKDEQKTIILAKANMLIYMLGMIREPRYDTKICTTI